MSKCCVKLCYTEGILIPTVPLSYLCNTLINVCMLHYIFVGVVSVVVNDVFTDDSVSNTKHIIPYFHVVSNIVSRKVSGILAGDSKYIADGSKKQNIIQNNILMMPHDTLRNTTN